MSSHAAPAEASIAVLAFADMSPGKDQEYFSDGMAEEILNALAKVAGLKVAGRTSSFSFKGKNIDSKTIGESLDVAQILEGSVRKQAERVRITAQLLRAKDGINVWSDSYDGTLADIFDLQERIARDIAGRLKVVLLSKDSRLVAKATTNTAAYTAFVEAAGLVNKRQDLRHAIDLLSDATKLDPQFARAWSKLAVANAVAPQYTDLPWLTGWAAGEAAARRALRLDPSDATALFWESNALSSMGRTAAAEGLIDRLLKNDPINPPALTYEGQTRLINGDPDQMMQASERAVALGYPIGYIGMSNVAAQRGDQVRAAADFVRGWGAIHSAFSAQDLATIYRGVDSVAEFRAKALTIVDAHSVDPLAPTMYLYLSQPEKAFATFQRYKSGLSDAFFISLWGPAVWSRYARQHSSFQVFARQLGMTAYWKKNGWPDLCQPAPTRGPDAFDCTK